MRFDEARRPSAAIARKHPLGSQRLAQRVLADERVELAHDVGVTAEREVGADAALEGVRARLHQPCDLRCSRRPSGSENARRSARTLFCSTFPGVGGGASAQSASMRRRLETGSLRSETPVPQPAPTWPVNPQTIPRPHEVAVEAGSGFDWDSASIGAATVLGAFAVGSAGVAVVRRRRIARVSLPTH